ncbi:DUF6513 domain-containing protein [Paludisphaera rhizosphaerae]|uniref:DUF6513 domain-containing protein n=1 Tax=Paludisphaera rhizosphaerae TaxID=2711216 RepID=UPI0013E9B029|nr:DUF6513 domain-containing protein [Paludisphaera rhizosphaerae]
MTDSPRPRVLFVTGRLAEFALRKVLDDLAPRAGIEAQVAVLPITVAALMTPAWIAKRLETIEGLDRVILPGHCRGDLGAVAAKVPGAKVEVGPEDLRDLPRWFGGDRVEAAAERYGSYDIEILAEINHAPRLPLAELLRQAREFAAQGADLIDVGCEPGAPWAGVGEAVRALRDEGLRVSIDSFDPDEVAQAVAAGAELVLSVNASNREAAKDWGAEVVAIPDGVGSLDGLDETVDALEMAGVRYRLDPILEPIGFGFAESLGRYLEARRRWPEAAMMMGVGNLTELTDVDSAGINALLMGFCQEQRIFSVLTTAVINWARSSVRELDLARRLARFAVANRLPPKRVDPGLVMLRDPKLERFGPDDLAELQRRIRDPNWRIFAEDGLVYALNNQHFLSGADPFAIFEAMGVSDASHAFYLGWEMMKARTALTLGKAYRQDQALAWGFLTEPEKVHRLQRGPVGRAVGPSPSKPPTPESGPASTPEEDDRA